MSPSQRFVKQDGDMMMLLAAAPLASGMAVRSTCCPERSAEAARQISRPTEPALVVVDLDFTLWWRPRFTQGAPFTSVADGLEGVRSACGETLDLYPGAREALARLNDVGIPVALASRTHRERWAREWLDLLRVDADRTVMDVVGAMPVIIRDGPKVLHLVEASRQTNLTLSSMLFFDDNFADVARATSLGVTAVHCSGGNGLTADLLDEGLRRFAHEGGAEAVGRTPDGAQRSAPHSCWNARASSQSPDPVTRRKDSNSNASNRRLRRRGRA